MSIYLFLYALDTVVRKVETRKGILKILSNRPHQIGLFDLAFAAAMIIGSCGCIHYALSLSDRSAYSAPLTGFDGLYFSVVTFATVGYGDIYPRSIPAKLTCMGEIATGCLVLIFAVNVSMTMWLRKTTEVKKEEAANRTDTSGAPMA